MTEIESEPDVNVDRHWTRRQAPTVLHLDESDVEDSSLDAIEGSITVMWAERGTEMLEEFERAMTLEDTDLAAEVKEEMVEAVKASTEGDTDGSPDKFDLVYDGEALATDLVADTDSFGTALVSYNGGKLDETQFRIRERSEGTLDNEYDYFVIVAPPSLSEAEKQAVELTSDESASSATSEPIQATYIAAATAVMAVTSAAQTGGTAKQTSLSESETLDVSEDEESGVGASVDELIEKRSELLG